LELTSRAIEVTGSIDAGHNLVLDAPLPFHKCQNVRVIILMPEHQEAEDTTEMDETEWLSAASRNMAFDFLNEEQEDIYTPEDGIPFAYPND
jgi:hypothetical protein